MLKPIAQRLAEELNVRLAQVSATIELFDGGATVPFVARYRKEATGGLDDTQLRLLDERLRYLRELDDRRDTIVKSIAEQGKLSPEVESALYAAGDKTTLEDLYLPYKPKRRTKAQIAREAGLAPLAETLLADPSQTPEAVAAGFVNADNGVADIKVALDGARAILIERFAEDAQLLGELRDKLWREGEVVARVVPGKESAGAKFADYFAHEEPLRSLPSHRALALLRGRNEECLTLALRYQPEDTPLTQRSEYEQRIAARFGLTDQGRPADKWLLDSVRLCWRAKIFLSLELELFGRVREAAEEEAIQVFARNLHDLLLAAPAGPRATLGLDPGLRTGVKVAVVDATGKLLDTATIYPHEPRRDWDRSLATLGALCTRHKVDLIAIGNGTASRETDRLAADLIRLHPELGMTRIVVSEAGASVYSASELAAREFPDLDVSLRGAVSIARRLQDPLAELVKIDPKSIGVGQYQHDVDQGKLSRSLDAVVEDAVNAVGVDLNTASAPLLSRVSGLGKSSAEAIVAHRDANGPFESRKELMKVARLGARTFEQCAGFLRIPNGKEPLDASSVHPEAYGVAKKIVAACGRDVRALMGDSAALKQLDPRTFVDERFGLPTVRDILAELEKPGRDPRPEFRTATFADGVDDIKDLKVGMMLEGTVTNVAAFGAFVDIGVHQDGLVHVSQLADRFIKDPHEIVKAGDVVKVRVTEVDVPRKRIGLTMRKDGGAPAARDNAPRNDRNAPMKPKFSQAAPKQQAPSQGAFGAALAEAMKRK